MKYMEISLVKTSVEDDILLPSSPYSASKASADLIINSFIKTYNFPGFLRLCNNYGFIKIQKNWSRIILKILNNKDIPIYGDGKNKREWILLKMHVKIFILQY